MKKKLFIYGFFAVVYTLLTVILTSSIMDEVNILVRFLINLAAISFVYVIANLKLNYKETASRKTCLGHAVLLAVLACVIALSIDGIKGNSDSGSAIISEEKVSDENSAKNNDIQMEVAFSDQDTSSRIVQIFLDALIAYIGGVIGMKLYNKKYEDQNRVAIL